MNMGGVRGVLGTAGLVLIPLLCGCDDNASPPSDLADELAEHDGRVCPGRLPLGADTSGHGFGVDEPADETPTLPRPRAAWVCKYEPRDVARTSNGGTVVEWVRAGRPAEVKADRLPELADAFDEFSLLPEEQGCTAELGPRWMLVSVHEGDLTGVLIEDYGCGSVRLTDDPFDTPPAEGEQGGSVRGVLQAPDGLLDTVKAAY
jgi:hypothetical protein